VLYCLRTDPVPDHAVSVKEHLTALLDRQLTVWWLQDTVFREPRVDIVMEINVPLCRQSAYLSVLCSLYPAVLGDAMDEIAYFGASAGFSYGVTQARLSGFQVAMSGYSHNMDHWVALVMETFVAVPVSEERFQAAKALLLQVATLSFTVVYVTALVRTCTWEQWWYGFMGCSACLCCCPGQDMRNLKFGQVYQQAQRELRQLMRTSPFPVDTLVTVIGS
jgi:hypothetical protein